MYELIIGTAESARRRFALAPGRTVVGKGAEADVRIDNALLSRAHCAVDVDDGHVRIEDMSSTNGTWIDDEPVTEAVILEVGVPVRLGHDVYMCIQEEGRESGGEGHPLSEAPRGETLSDEALQEIKQEIQRRILEFLDLRRRGSLDQMTADEIRAEVRSVAESLIEQGEIQLPAQLDRGGLITAIVAEAIGLGAIEPLLEDTAISEIMVNGPDQIYVERNGRIELCDSRFSGTRALMNVIDRIVTPVGRRVDEGHPMIDARLHDGSRFNAIIPPLALGGPTVTIRKFAQERLRGEDLVRFGSITQEMLEFLMVCVRYRQNIVVSGGTGSGKTTTLNIISDFVPEYERIVTIEDSAELKLSQEHVVSLEARPANIEGTGEVTIRDLVRNSLRMRPDRIVIGECRGGEALDMLQAMNTGHDGSLTTAHANSPRDMLSRLEVMVMMSGMELPSRAIREQIAAAVDIIIQVTRLSDGRRLVTDIHEVGHLEGNVISLQQVFTFKRTGIDPDGKITGYHTGLGYAPTFYQELKRAGINLDWRIFTSVEKGKVLDTT